jgi:hypothetical protein
VERKYLDAAWIARINKRWARVASPVYCLDNQNRTQTDIFAITGKGCAIEKGNYNGYADVRLEDAPSDAILAMEVADSKVHWMQPGDYDVTQLLAAKGTLGDHVKSILPHRIHVLFADGEVWTLSDKTPMAAVKPFLTIAEAKTHDRDKLLGPYRVD